MNFQWIPLSYNKLTLLPALLCVNAVFGQGASKSAHADIDRLASTGFIFTRWENAKALISQ